MTSRPRFNLWTLPWHPVLLVAAIVLAFWMDAGVSPYTVFRAAGVAVVGAIVATALGSLLLRGPDKGGVLVSAVILALYSKHAVRVAVGVAPTMPIPVLVAWALAIMLALALAARLLRKAASRATWPQATSVLNRVALVFLIASVGLGIANGRIPRGIADLRQGSATLPQDSAPDANRPRDIYVILLDGYPRADVLEFAFDMDNSRFEGELQTRGFDIAPQAHSDYLWTHVSVPSLLNMAYVEQIETLQQIVRGERSLHPGIADSINHNPVFDAARAQGFSVVAIGGGFEHVSARQADVFLDSGHLNEVEFKLLNSTYLGQLVSVIAPTFASGEWAERIRESLKLLGDVAATPSSAPRLVFAHIPTPHQPSVFRSNGDAIPVPINDDFFADSASERGQSLDQFTSEYRGHLAYLNGLVLQAVDEVLRASATPPVIVLVADHGSASRVNWLVAQPDEVDPARLLERTGILFAALTPERSDVFPDDISPVNVFRYLFDAYFDTELGPATPPPGGGHIEPVDPSVLN